MIKNERTINPKTKNVIVGVKLTMNGEPSFKIALNKKNPINETNNDEKPINDVTFVNGSHNHNKPILPANVIAIIAIVVVCGSLNPNTSLNAYTKITFKYNEIPIGNVLDNTDLKKLPLINALLSLNAKQNDG